MGEQPSWASLALAFGLGGLCTFLLQHAKKRFLRCNVADKCSGDDSDAALDAGPCKMVLVVRSDLKMSKGKIAAQCGHATLGCYRRAERKNQDGLRRWTKHGQTKVALKCASEADLLEIEAKAKAAGLTHYVVCDAGRTQIAAGSLTVCGVGPNSEEAVNAVTGHLKLL